MFPWLAMQRISSFIKQVWFFLKKCLRVAGFLPYMQISDMIPGVNIIAGKVSVANVNGTGILGGGAS